MGLFKYKIFGNVLYIVHAYFFLLGKVGRNKICKIVNIIGSCKLIPFFPTRRSDRVNYNGDLRNPNRLNHLKVQ